MLDLSLSMPKEMGGSGRAATNPEQLFAAGYAGCLSNALLRAAREAKVKIEAPSVTARVGIGRGDDGRFGLTVALEIDMQGTDQAEAETLTKTAHWLCPYSNAVRGNVIVGIHVVGAGGTKRCIT
jgi:Ohr subfamily peroxiredoxin